MRLTIIPIDKSIIIDNIGFNNIDDDFSWIPSDVHAVQWYDTWGEIEYNNNNPNTKINQLGIYKQAVDIFNNESKKVTEQVKRLAKGI